MEDIDIKKVIIAIIIVLVLAVGVFFIVKNATTPDKSYTLEQIQESDYKYFAVYTDGKCGVINKEGKIILNSEFEDVIIPNPTKAVFICKKDGSFEIFNDSKEKLFENLNNVRPIETDGNTTHLPYEKSVLKYEEDGKFGLIDFEGNTITKAIYEEIRSVKYKEGEVLAKKDGKAGVINNKGVELIPFEYEEIEADNYYSGNYEKSGYITKNKTSNGYRYGYIDCKWKKILDTEYTEIKRILDISDEDVYLIAAKNGQYGLIKNKDEEIEFSYQSISYNKDTNLLVVQKSEKYGVLDLNGESIVPTQYQSIRFNGIYICAKSYEEETYFNSKGEKIENKITGMKEIDNIDVYITTDENNLYGIANKKRRYIS